MGDSTDTPKKKSARIFLEFFIFKIFFQEFLFIKNSWGGNQV